jgi:hypothetical protein
LKLDATGDIDILLIFQRQSSDFCSTRVLPANPDAECIVSLAVCDMTRNGSIFNPDCPVTKYRYPVSSLVSFEQITDIRRAAKKIGALKACRDVGKLPGI